MADRFGLDSVSAVPAAAHHAVGSSVALRYLSRYTAKVVTASEYQNYRAHGIDLVLVFEDGAANAKGGYPNGKADAEFALNQAHSVVGKTVAPLAIRSAVDYDTAGNPGETDGYFDGWAAVLTHPLTGPYGGIEVVSHQANRHFESLWQALAWSYGRFDKRASIYQNGYNHTVGGVGVDFNRLYGLDFGQVDRHLAALPDPHGYLRFPTNQKNLVGGLRDVKAPYDSPFGPLDERLTILQYDGAMKHPIKYELYLKHQLRPKLEWLARRIVKVVRGETTTHSGMWPFPPNWKAFHRGWRVQQLLARAQGHPIPAV